MQEIVVHSASANNLQNVSANIPKNCLIAVAGPSGSGKSSFVFEVLAKQIKRKFLAPFLEENYWDLRENAEIKGAPFPLEVILDSQRINAKQNLLQYLKLETEINNFLQEEGILYCKNCSKPHKIYSSQDLLAEIKENVSPVIEILLHFSKPNKLLIDKILRGGLNRVFLEGDFLEFEKIIPAIENKELENFYLSITAFSSNQQNLEKRFYSAWEIIKELNANAVFLKVENQLKEFAIGNYCLYCRSFIDPSKENLRFQGKSFKEISELNFCQLEELFFKSNKILEKLSQYDYGNLKTLQLSRDLQTLSLSEFKMLSLLRCFSSDFQNMLLLFDEPGAMLTKEEVQDVSKILKKLSLNNTVIIIEHNLDLISQADYLIEFGPGSGHLGGRITYAGNVAEYLKTKKYLVSKSNLKKFSTFDRKIDIKQEAFTVISGKMGSGKTTLLSFIAQSLKNKSDKYEITGLKTIKNIYHLSDFSRINNISSTVASVSGIYPELIEIFSKTNEAKFRGLKKEHFNYNKKQGACLSCGGTGLEEIKSKDLQERLSNVCSFCQGSRLNQKVQDICYKGYTFLQILNLSIAELLEKFRFNEKLMRKVELIRKIGLSHLVLKQRVLTLSTGEKHRLRLTELLSKSNYQNTLILIDGLSSGITSSELEIVLDLLDSFISQGATIVVADNNELVQQRAEQVYLSEV